MTPTKKVLLVLGSAFGLCILGWVLLVGAVYAWGGVMMVRIDNPSGPDLSIPVPMAVVDVALATGELVFEDIHLNLGEYGPMLREILEVIDDCPDVTFVEVEDGGDHVRVAKEGGTLRIVVEEHGRDGVSVTVSLPMRSIGRLLGV